MGCIIVWHWPFSRVIEPISLPIHHPTRATAHPLTISTRNHANVPMPHAVIAGVLTPEDVHRTLEPFQIRDEGYVGRLGESHLARNGSRALVETVVVERTIRRAFLIEIGRRDDGVTVRLFPFTDPEKTDGVRRMLAAVATAVCALSPDARVVRTNLAPHLVVALAAAEDPEKT